MSSAKSLALFPLEEGPLRACTVAGPGFLFS